jgi:triacylglycerol lipase
MEMRTTPTDRYSTQRILLQHPALEVDNNITMTFPNSARIFRYVFFPTLILTALCVTNAAFAVADDERTQARFRMLYDYALLANATYLGRDAIEKAVHDQGYSLTVAGEAPGYAVSYFVATNAADKTQVIAVRGTSNAENALVDFAFQLLPDEATGIDLHQGFAKSARAIYEQIRPKLNKDYHISTTGHSLGGAAALVLAMYLDVDGYTVDKVITFGQPKVTNITGSLKFEHLNVTRVVRPKDMVPLVPPLDPLDLKNLSIFWHIGTEIILLDGDRYAEIDGIDSMLRATSFLNKTPNEENLQNHMMAGYLSLIKQKLDHAERVPWKNDFNFFGWGSKP